MIYSVKHNNSVSGALHLGCDFDIIVINLNFEGVINMKSKKTLIIILVAVVVLGAAIGAFKIYSDQKKMTDEIVDLLFKGKSVSQFQIDSMLEGEYNIGEKYLKIKDTEKFRTRIFEEVKAFLEEHSDAVNFDYVHEKLALVESEGLLTDDSAGALVVDVEVAFRV